MPGVPGRGGPPPKRSDQRRRRNKVDLDSATSDGVVRGPELEGEHSPVAVRFYEALRRSGQAQYFEPSDWAAAELVVLAIDSFDEKRSAMLLASINSAMTNLLVTEGDRRRSRLELERGGSADQGPDEVVVDLADRRLRLAG